MPASIRRLPSTWIAAIVPPGTAAVVAAAGRAARTRAAGTAREVVGAAGPGEECWGVGGGAGWAATDTAHTLDSRHAANGRARLMRIKRLLPPLKRYCQACAATARIGWLMGAGRYPPAPLDARRRQQGSVDGGVAWAPVRPIAGTGTGSFHRVTAAGRGCRGVPRRCWSRDRDHTETACRRPAATAW